MNNEAFEQQNARPAPQPRPALTLVSGARVLPLEQFDCFLGVSTHASDLKQFVALHAPQRHPTLLIGERGLRQEQIARALHQASEHWAQPFFSVNAHSMPADALHALLFGPKGVLESCQRGTIYVNELTSLSLLLQQRFAAYLEEQRWRASAGKAGGQRLIFATAWDPKELRAENRLAYGLVELLRPTSLTLKPLRERSEDIPYLAEALAGKVAGRLGKGRHEISGGAMKVLREYGWEGNIEELEAVIEGAIASTAPPRIEEGMLPGRVRYATLKAIPPGGVDLPHLVDEYERGVIEAALRQTNGNQTKAARLLGLRVQTLNMKLKRFSEQAS